MQAWQRTSLPLFAVSAQSNTSRKDEAATSTVAQDPIFQKLQDPYIVNAAQSGVILLYPTTHLATVGSWTQKKEKYKNLQSCTGMISHEYMACFAMMENGKSICARSV